MNIPIPLKRRIPPSLKRRIKQLIGRTTPTEADRSVDFDPSKMWGRIFDLSKKELVQLNGFSLYVMPDDYVGGPILKTKGYETHVTSVIRTHLKEGDVFLDLGANIGYFTLLASSLVGDYGKVLAFEPNPQSQQLLFASILESKSENVTVYPWAVSDKQQVLRFTTVGSNGGVVTPSAASQTYYLLVQAVILDEVLSQEPRIDLVKMDIEAHEPIALRGMKELIKRHKPKLITEFHPWAMRINNLEPPSDYLRQLFDFGYRISIIETSGELLNVASPNEIVSYQERLSETAHVDLFARF